MRRLRVELFGRSEALGSGLYPQRSFLHHMDACDTFDDRGGSGRVVVTPLTRPPASGRHPARWHGLSRRDAPRVVASGGPPVCDDGSAACGGTRGEPAAPPPSTDDLGARGGLAGPADGGYVHLYGTLGAGPCACTGLEPNSSDAGTREVVPQHGILLLSTSLRAADCRSVAVGPCLTCIHHTPRTSWEHLLCPKRSKIKGKRKRNRL
jgi:hypothetical protein